MAADDLGMHEHRSRPDPALPVCGRVVCIGGAVLDRKYRARKELIFETSNPVDFYPGFGGVGRNVAENLVRLGVDISFVSIVGDDPVGRDLLRHLHDLGADVSPVVSTAEKPTAEYAAILGTENELVLGLANMEIFDLFQPDHLDGVWPRIAESRWVFMDCNMPAATIRSLLSRKQAAGFRLAIDTVSAPKAARLPGDLSGIDLLFTNRDEANVLLGRQGADPVDAAEAAQALREAGVPNVIVTKGAQGYAVATGEGVATRHSVTARPVDITGAGDAMIAGTIYRLLAGEPLQSAARTGALLAALTVESRSSVHPDLSPRFLSGAMSRLPA